MEHFILKDFLKNVATIWIVLYLVCLLFDQGAGSHCSVNIFETQCECVAVFFCRRPNPVMKAFPSSSCVQMYSLLTANMEQTLVQNKNP